MKIATLLFALIAAPSADKSGAPILLDFHASWCGPCRQMRPAVEQLIQTGYPVKSVDIDASPELAARYQVTAVPTFVVIDSSGRALARTSGAQPAEQLVSLYREAKAKLATTGAAKAPVVAEESDERPPPAADSDEKQPKPKRTNPNPWETVVRIKVISKGAIGFGSGTIIHSTPQESIILTCAHIFKSEGPRQARPDQFSNKIVIDLFDGKLSGQEVHYANETCEGEALDYDFGLDVGLIRIRPGRRLPASRVVPAKWHPQPRMAMMTVGCSEGHDATAWSTTILNPSMKGLSGKASYEAIECWHAPKQGRSGGGLYTTDGYLAGVCDFAEPRGNHGLYATPASIYRLLDRNKLMALYAPVPRNGGAILARNDRPASNRNQPAPSVRGQSPDRDESDDVTIPPPELLGVKPLQVASNAPTVAAATGRTAGWVPKSKPIARVSEERETAVKVAPNADNDPFADIPPSTKAPTDEPAAAPSARQIASKWRPVKTAPAR